MAHVRHGRHEAEGHTVLLLGIVLMAFIIVASFACLRRLAEDRDGYDRYPRGDRLEDAPLGPDVEARRPIQLDEDVYGMGISLIARDWSALSKGPQDFSLHTTRLVFACCLLFGAMGLQILILYGTKAYVTPQQVRSIRESYDAYELWMYPNNTIVISTGYHRGIDGYLVPENFETLDEDVKSEVCQIPFSQLQFLTTILIIWTLTCVEQISRCVRLGYNFIYLMPTVSTMADAIIIEEAQKPRRKRYIVGLTFTAKLLLLFLVFLPWLATVCYLCWLGCRWLAATNEFGDFLANGMALEFILQLSRLIYMAVASERIQRDVQCTRYMPASKYEDASFLVYFVAVIWAFAAAFWVWYYIFHFQSVLPQYKWDVHEFCTPYLMGVNTVE